MFLISMRFVTPSSKLKRLTTQTTNVVLFAATKICHPRLKPTQPAGKSATVVYACSSISGCLSVLIIKFRGFLLEAIVETIRSSIVCLGLYK